MLGFYKLFIGSKVSFLKPYEGMDTMYQQALVFWNKLDSVSFVFIIIFLVLGILGAYIYYGPYNEQARRHYLVKHWLKFLGISALVGLVVTFAVAYIAAPPRVNGSWSIEIMLAIGNAILVALVYLVTSLVWCNFLPTNAYRFLKINKKK